MTEWLLNGATPDPQSITSDWDFVNQSLIEGVQVREVKHVLTGYGHLTEVYRSDWGLDTEGVDQVFQATLGPWQVSAWHAHAQTTDRLFVNRGTILIVLYDARVGSPSFGRINTFRMGSLRPGLVIVPPKVWHGIQNIGGETAALLNLVDVAYQYEGPDHWRIPHDSPEVPYQFRRPED